MMGLHLGLLTFHLWKKVQRLLLNSMEKDWVKKLLRFYILKNQIRMKMVFNLKEMIKNFNINKRDLKEEKELIEIRITEVETTQETIEDKMAEVDLEETTEKILETKLITITTKTNNDKRTITHLTETTDMKKNHSNALTVNKKVI
eukprot:GHVR01159484.1.p1 GENE.GHVR01159484.1~~GHVR01159484.1.p1  ORF type:complete len:146 (+),score=19.91 GHVR01159484.1:1960-2397(+)